VNENLLGMLASQLGPSMISQISKSLGSNDSATQNVVSSALPVLISALTGRASSQNGAESLFNALTRNQKHDGSVFNNLDRLVEKPDEGEGDGILGHIFGNKRQNIERDVSEACGVDQGGTSKIFKILAPMVLGALGKQQRQNNWSPSDLSNSLAKSQKQFTDDAPDEMGIVGRLLDRDGDGKVADDVASIGLKLLSGFFRR